MKLTNEEVAKLCHEANRAYCKSIGDDTQLPWEQAPEFARISALKGVEFHLANPDAGPSASHESWLKEKAATGWKWGPVKDIEKKEHHCIVAFNMLPKEQQAKDYIFSSIVHTLATL